MTGQKEEEKEKEKKEEMKEEKKEENKFLRTDGRINQGSTRAPHGPKNAFFAANSLVINLFSASDNRHPKPFPSLPYIADMSFPSVTHRPADF